VLLDTNSAVSEGVVDGSVETVVVISMLGIETKLVFKNGVGGASLDRGDLALPNSGKTGGEGGTKSDSSEGMIVVVVGISRQAGALGALVEGVDTGANTTTEGSCP
jgi:hypothetical protein